MENLQRNLKCKKSNFAIMRNNEKKRKRQNSFRNHKTNQIVQFPARTFPSKLKAFCSNIVEADSDGNFSFFALENFSFPFRQQKTSIMCVYNV